MKLLGYCLIAALVGVLMYAGLLAWPVTYELFYGPGGLDPARHWLPQLAAMALAGVVTALVFRPAIRRVVTRWQHAFVSLMFVLAGSVAAGALLLLLTDLHGGASVHGWRELAFGTWFGAVMGLVASLAFLPIGFPIALGGVFVLRRLVRPARTAS